VPLIAITKTNPKKFELLKFLNPYQEINKENIMKFIEAV